MESPSRNRNLDALMRGIDRLLWEYADSDGKMGKCKTCEFCKPLFLTFREMQQVWQWRCSYTEAHTADCTAATYGYGRLMVKPEHGCIAHMEKVGENDG